MNIKRAVTISTEMSGWKNGWTLIRAGLAILLGKEAKLVIHCPALEVLSDPEAKTHL